MIALAKDWEVRSRIALEVNRHEGPPIPNVTMFDSHWLDLEGLDTDWIDTGNAEWRDGYAWRGIQIHAGDLAIALGTKGRHSRTNLQPVAPPPASLRLPPEQPFVTLSHALTWIAFGVSMDNDQLHEVLSASGYGEDDPQEAIKAALSRLVSLGSGGNIAMRGKYRNGRHDDESTLLTEVIEPIRLTDYRLFSYLDDELRHGEGLLFWRNEDGTIFDLTVGDGRKDSFLQVTVNRVELLREFPPPPKKMRTIFSPGELFTDNDPDDASPWWSVRQTLAWVATRTCSYVAAVGRAERDSSSELNWVVIQATLDVQLAESDEGKAYLSTRQDRWPEGSIFAHAGREVLSEIEARRIAPATIEAGKRRVMGWHEFAGLGSSETGSDWLDLDPQPVFSSAEVIAAFPALQRPVEAGPLPKKAGELPIWLNPYQLVAWVQYRDLHVVAKASDWNGLAAQHMYGDDPKVGTVAEVEGALQEGRLIAQGYPKNGDSFAPIPAVEWSRIALAPRDLYRQHPYLRIQFDRRDVLAIFPAIGGERIAGDQSNAETEAAAPRAPAVKAGRPPSDEEILAKADEMKARGMDGRTIAKEMRLEPGFQNVATTAVRELIKGRWKPGGRPKKSA